LGKKVEVKDAKTAVKPEVAAKPATLTKVAPRAA